MLFSPFHEVDNVSKSKCRFCDSEQFSKFKELIKHEASHYKLLPPPAPSPKIEIKIEKIELNNDEECSVPPTPDQESDLNYSQEQNDLFDIQDFDFDDDDYDIDSDIEINLEEMEYDFKEFLANILANIGEKSSKLQTKFRHKYVEKSSTRFKEKDKREDVLAVIERVQNYDYEKDAIIFIDKSSGTRRTMFKCRICKKRIQSKYNFFHHMLVHNGEKPYTCQYCSYASNQPINRDKHERLLHKNKLKVKLPIIKSPEIITTDLKPITTISKAKKLFNKKDEKVEKKSKLKKKLDAKLQIQKCKTKPSLKKAKISKEKSKPLNIPNDRLESNNEIGNSVIPCSSSRIEMEDKILFEMKSFNWIGDFVKTGTGSKGSPNFECNICQKVLLQHSRSQLYLHKLGHTGVKPFSCQYCLKEFLTPWGRDQHEVLCKHVEERSKKSKRIQNNTKPVKSDDKEVVDSFNNNP